DVTVPEARRWVEHYFGSIPRGPKLTRPTVAGFSLPADVFGTLEDRVQVPRVYDAWHTQKAFGADDAALDFAAELLAGGKSSRLYKRLVYELEIANQVV